MGTGLAWFSVESAELADIATTLDVKVTGRRGPRERYPLAARKLVDGRWLVVSSNCDEPLFNFRRLAIISRKGRTFSGMFEEHVMASAFAAWGKGRKAWSLQHQGDVDPLHLKTTGKLPKDIAALRDSALERQRREGEQAEADYLYELPIGLIQSHAGLDPETDFDDGEFEQLHIGFWRDLWRRTFWWRLGLGFLAMLAAICLAMVPLAWALNHILAWLGWR
jgi:hypothetical protein